MFFFENRNRLNAFRKINGLFRERPAAQYDGRYAVRNGREDLLKLGRKENSPGDYIQKVHKYRHQMTEADRATLWNKLYSQLWGYVKSRPQNWTRTEIVEAFKNLR